MPEPGWPLAFALSSSGAGFLDWRRDPPQRRHEQQRLSVNKLLCGGASRALGRGVFVCVCVFALWTNQSVGSPGEKISPELKPQVSPCSASPHLLGCVPGTRTRSAVRGRVARWGDGGICEWCCSARGG